jgi:hypothetical protein
MRGWGIKFRKNSEFFWLFRSAMLVKKVEKLALEAIQVKKKFSGELSSLLGETNKEDKATKVGRPILITENNLKEFLKVSRK